MTSVPYKNASGGLDCPKCGTTLVKGKSAFYLQGEYVGVFDSFLCDMCHYSVLTALGYDNAIKEARKYGLVGPEEEVISETVEPLEHEFIFEDITSSSNLDHDIYVTLDPNTPTEVNSITEVGKNPVLRKQFRENQPSKFTEVLVK